MKSFFFNCFLLTAVISLVFSFKAHAQDDYVVTINGDTLKCKIRVKFFPHVDSPGQDYKYQTATMKSFESINFKDFKGFGLTSKKIVFRAVVDKYGENKYMKTIEDGKICLYENNEGPTSRHSTDWYVGKDIAKVFILKTAGIIPVKSRSDRKAGFAELLKDNKDVYDLFLNEDKFSWDEIRRVVQLYNTGQTEIQPE
jgi:hypothetical protein